MDKQPPSFHSSFQLVSLRWPSSSDLFRISMRTRACFNKTWNRAFERSWFVNWGYSRVPTPWIIFQNGQSHGEVGWGCLYRCRDSILYRLVLAYFTAHDHWASQHNITIMCRAIPHIMHSFPAIMCQTQDTFLHSRNAFPHSRLARVHHASSCSIAHLCIPLCIFVTHLCILSRIFAFYHASLHFITHLCILSRIFAFYHASLHFITHLCILSRIFAFHRASSYFIVI